MFTYRAYGIGVASTFPLPELVAAETPCEIMIRCGEAHELPTEGQGQRRFFRVTPTEAILAFKGIGRFLVRGGCDVLVFPDPDSDARLVRLALIGAVLAVVLYQRGRLALHASAVAFWGGAVAFMGESGWGKSTLAAALHAGGHQILADDITAIDFATGSPTVSPSYPQMKLSAESASALGYAEEELFELYSFAVKRGWQIAERFGEVSLPLRQVYVLAEHDTVRIDRLTPQEALIELVRHSYPTRLEQPGGARHFAECVWLARDIPVYRLGRPKRLEELHALARIVEAHLDPRLDHAVGTDTIQHGPVL